MRTAATILILVGLVGCYPDRSAQPPRTAQVRPPVTPSPRTQRGKGPVMAYVNDRPIYMAGLHDILVRANGVKLAQYLIVNELVDQAAAAKGISVTDDDIRKQNALTLKEMFPKIPDNAQRVRLLEQFLVQKNMPRRQWDMVVRRNALVAKLAGKKIEVTEAELRREFGRQFGQQVVIRHIQTASLADAQKVLKLLMDKGDFTQLARKYSTNASSRNGGLLPPIGKDTARIAPAIREAALAMTKVGEISNPVQAGTTFHILKLERIIEPTKVKFEDVKQELEAAIQWYKAQVIQRLFLTDLVRKAKIQYVDPILKAQADKGAGP
jgi:foldase protein PrsA